VNPDILRWARETASLTLEKAAEKLQLNPARGVSAADRLISLEAGDPMPTRPMLVRMAKLYRRPLLTFYLSAPPRRGDRGQDFRTLPADHAPADEALLDTLIRDVRARQSLVRAALEDEDEVEPLSFVGSKDMTDGVPSVLSSIRDTIQISLREFRSQSSPQEAFGLLRSGAEKAGFFVLLMGDLGSYHTAIDLETFRGFALADDVAPFVVINDQDSKAAWSFTLLHELTHIWLGQTGVSGACAELAIEQFCNDVAGEFLLPEQELSHIAIGDWPDIETMAVGISTFARENNLSSSMVAYKLFRAGAIDRERWLRLSQGFRDQWLERRDRQRELARDQEGGPSFYVVRRHRVGNALLDLVGRMVNAGTLATSKAGKVLGVKAKQVQALLGAEGLGGARSLA